VNVLAMLEHAQIEVPGKDPIDVLFNPTEYELEASFGLEEKPVIGQRSVMQFTGAAARTLTMDLLFDTYERRTDVRNHTKKVYALTEMDPVKHRPPIVTFRWGSLHFPCVVQSVRGRFTLFLDNGWPVRATLTVSFKEFVDASQQPKPESADHTKTYLVQRGDSLSSIAAAEYGNPATWRPIATANAIDNPRMLVPGQRIVIPPLPERRGSA
jgi:nucleoid-associated protein YgaU